MSGRFRRVDEIPQDQAAVVGANIRVLRQHHGWNQAKLGELMGWPGGQGPPPPVHRHPRHLEMPGDLPVAGPGLDHLRGGQPHPLPAGPLRRVQAAAIGIPHDSGIAHQAPDDQTW